MSRAKLVNEYVRKQLKKFRNLKGLTQQEVARRAKLPLSSYACLEAGFYELRLDNLFRMLAALDLDIFDIWPSESYLSTVPGQRTKGARSGYDHLYLKRIQEFRLNDVVMLSGAEGAALFVQEETQCRVLLQSHLSESWVERMRLFIASRTELPDGFTFTRKTGKKELALYLKCKVCPPYLAQLIERYLLIWSFLF
ncbi:MAG: helix-turn-helix transcriptional regulator [Acidobacteria bacterium]|nr:helix-turn-helix transcriptional regulator [Acidobacteriota bacterium]